MSLGGLNHVRWARELSWPRLLNMVSLPSGLGSASSIFSFIWIHLCVSIPGSGVSKTTGPVGCSLRILFWSAWERGVLTSPVSTWREATWMSQWLKVLAEPPEEHFRKSFLFWHLVQQCYQNPAASLMGTEFWGQGNVTDPKAVTEETSNRMLLCPLCNNVTKILMIKSHNLKFRINGFDVCLALLPSHRLPNSQNLCKYWLWVRDSGKVSPFCACVKNTHTNTLPHAELTMGLRGNCTHHTFQFIYNIFHTGKFGVG